MNHFHRIIFNRALGVRQVVSEIASSGRGAGTTSTVSSTGTGLRQMPRLCALAAACLLAWGALPEARAANCSASEGVELSGCFSGANYSQYDTVNIYADFYDDWQSYLNAPINVTVNGQGHKLTGSVSTTMSNKAGTTLTIVGFAAGSSFTTRTAGVLSTNAGANLGTSIGLFYDGTLRNTDAFTFGGAVVLNNQFGSIGGTFQTDADLGITAGIIGGRLTKTGSATLTLTGGSSYSGGTIISEGKLQLGNGGASGSIQGDVVDNATLAFNRSDAVFFGGVISGSGAVQQVGTGTTTLTGANAYSGGTNLDAGTLSVSADNNLGDAAGTLTFNGGTLQNTAAFTTTRAITLNAGGGTIQTDADLSATGTISGNGSLTKTGTGTLTLTGNNNYAGSTTISAGTLQVGNGGTTGSLGAGAVTNNATLVFNRSNNITAINDIGGTGTLAKQGAGTLILSGTNTYTGGTAITAGTLELATTGAAGSGDILVENASSQNSTLQVDAGVSINNQVAANNGATVNNSGSIVRTAAGSIGVLSYGGATINNSATGTIKGNDYGVLLFTGEGTVSNSGGLIESIGSGIWMQGTTGTVINEAGGTIRAGSHGVYLYSGGSVANDVGSTIIAGAGAASVLIGGGTLVNKGSLVGGVLLDPSGTGSAVNNVTLFTGSSLQGDLVIGPNTASSLILDGSGPQLLSDAVTGGIQFAGQLVQQGGGTWTVDKDLTPASTTIAAGSTMQFGNGGTVGSVTGPITVNGTLAVNRSDTLTLSSMIDGTGGLTQSGSGTTILTADNTYSDATIISAGTLQVGNGGGTGSLGTGAVTNNAALVFKRSGTLTVANDISGAGSLQKQGTGTLVLSSANAYTGGTAITAGTLELATTGAAGSGDILVENASSQNSTLQVDAGVSINNQVAANNGATVNNSGSIVRTAAGSVGVLSFGGATINNSATGTIKGNDAGVRLFIGGGTVTNNGGLIESTGSGASAYGIDIQNAAGTVINQAGGTIKSQADAVHLSAGGSVVNDVGSTIIAGAGRSSVFINGGTLVNKGSLVGHVTLDPSLTGTAINTATLFTGSSLQGSLVIGPNTASSLILDGSGPQLLSDAVTGGIQFAGKLVQQGGGTWTVDKDLTPASTTIAAGSTMQLGNGGTVGSVTGPVTVNGTLAVNRSDTLTLSSTIDGTGGLTQSGSGTTILAGNNTYSGGTTISDGILQLGNSGTTGSLTGNVLNNAALVFGRSDNALNFSGAISGSGTVRQGGTGTVTLSSANTYSGGTNLDAGTLSVSTDNNLGNAAGGLTFNGGALQNTAAFSTTRAITLNAGGGALQTDADLSAAGAIGGTGGLTKTGTGTLELLGNNNYSGSTTISAGTLQVGNGGTSGSLGSGSVTNNAALVFNRSDAVTVANPISGTGSLTKMGAGKLLLTGANTYTGATNVNAGTLSVNGSITSATTVGSGAALGGSGSVGNVNVLAGGVLAPGNSIGTLTVNGNLTFAPGSVFRVETDAAGNADRVNVVGAPGTLTINGGTVDVQAGAGNYARNTSYTILTSTGATTGAFTGVSSNLAFLTPTLSYQPNGVTLDLLAENAPVYNTVAQTPNQTSVANYLSSFANTPGNAEAAALIRQIDNLNAEQARVAFDAMSGSQHAAASQTAWALGRSFSSTLAMRTGSTVSTGLSNSSSSTAGLKAIKFASVSPALLTRSGDVVSDSPLRVAAADPSTEPQDRPALQSAGGLWGQAMGTGGRIGSDGNGPASRYRANGFVFGYDQPWSAEWLAGAALAYNKAQWDASTNGAAAASGSISSAQAGLYARYTAGPWQVRLDGTYSDHRFSTDRTVTIGNATSIARSSHGGTEWAFAAQAEYSLPAGDWDIRPLAGLRHARLNEDGFTETGAGAASLTVDARRSQNTVASLGMKFIRPLNQNNTDKGALELRAVASHLVGDNNFPLTSRLAGQPASFTTAGTPLKRSALTLGGTLTGQLSRGLSAYADAAYEYRGSGQNAFQFVAGLKLVW